MSLVPDRFRSQTVSGRVYGKELILCSGSLDLQRSGILVIERWDPKDEFVSRLVVDVCDNM